MRRLAERAPELLAEVRPREPGCAGEVGDRERVGVAPVGEVAGAEQVPLGRRVGVRRDRPGHAPIVGARPPPPRPRHGRGVEPDAGADGSRDMSSPAATV